MLKNTTKSSVWLFVLLISFSFTLHSCKKDNQEPQQTQFIGFVVPDNFPPPAYNFQNNPVTEEGFKLGRKLFYDPILSLDNSISCGSCHAQVHGFADQNNRFSKGIEDREGTRNSPALSNLAWYPSFMWDGGINHIEIMPIAPITEPNEMGETLNNVVTKLNNDSEYPTLFKNAFGVEKVDAQKLLFALTQFMGSMVSLNSKYDKYTRNEVSLTPDELNGLKLFRQHCENCHKEPLLTDFSFRNNGVGVTQGDSGRQRITLDPNDKGKFKVPSLRNVELTYPYMHDGSIYSLENVLEHYSSGITSSPTLDPSLQNGISLSQTEKTQLIAFLKTLTDYTYISDSRFSEPKN